jgi:serine/threonine protein kinase
VTRVVASASVIGESVGNFQIVSRLGRGGMGEVWLAEQQAVRTRVAIKMLHADVSTNETSVQRFFNEAVAVSQIRHAGIARIFDVGWTAQGRAYFVMEYLDGETLSARIARGPLPLRQVADLGRQIASVLDATHSAGVVHRDLKPDNIFIVPDAELASKERVKILDFGIAKLSSNPGMTAASVSSVGTPHYMAPEQWHSLAEVDWRTDAYALGCVAYEMACGAVPFPARSLGEACEKHLVEPPPVPSRARPELPPAFDALIARLLDKEPGPRPSMEEAMTVFAGLAEGRTVSLPRAGAAQTVAGHALGKAQIAALRQLWNGVPARATFASPALPSDSLRTAEQDSSGYYRAPRTTLPPSSGSPSQAVEMFAQSATPSQEISTLPPGALQETMIVPKPAKPKKGGAGLIVAILALLVGTGIGVVFVLYAVRNVGDKPAGSGSAPVKAAAPDAAPAPAPKAAVDEPPPQPEKKADRKKDRRKRPARKPVDPVAVPTPAAAKTGILGLDSDLVCEIELDGKPTGKSTPESFTVTAGRHEVRLINRDLGVEDSFEVEIEPDRASPIRVEFYEPAEAPR